MTRKKTDLKDKVIHTEKELIAFYDSLHLSGFWRDTHIMYLRAMRYWLHEKDKKTTPFEIARMACRGERFFLDEMMRHDYCRTLLHSFQTRYAKNCWDEITAMLEELVIALKVYCILR